MGWYSNLENLMKNVGSSCLHLFMSNYLNINKYCTYLFFGWSFLPYAHIWITRSFWKLHFIMIDKFCQVSSKTYHCHRNKRLVYLKIFEGPRFYSPISSVPILEILSLIHVKEVGTRMWRWHNMEKVCPSVGGSYTTYRCLTMQVIGCVYQVILVQSSGFVLVPVFTPMHHTSVYLLLY